MNNTNIQLTQWQKRLKLVYFIYSELILQNSQIDSRKILATHYFKIGADFMQVGEYFIDNKKNIIEKISPFLKSNWSFDRLNFVDQAILIESYCENLILHTNKATIIDQAVITSKKYSDNNHKFINAVLDKLIK